MSTLYSNQFNSINEPKIGLLKLVSERMFELFVNDLVGLINIPVGPSFKSSSKYVNH